MSMASPPSSPASLRRVVIASSAGTTFEWYDFFVFGTLTQTISRTFFAGLDETVGFIAALALFATGFAFRPIGALIFGNMGDRIGRKAAFLVTVSLMGGSTFAIGVLPTYQQIGIASPLLLIFLRIVQGTALGGEYGGAAVYVAEHAPASQRGGATGWIQAASGFGLIFALLVVLLARTACGELRFAAWGWRLPFLVSAGLLAISIWMRLKLTESPAFRRMKEEGSISRAPLREAFGQWRNLRLVLLALFAFMIAQGAVWYTTFFYTQIFLEKSLHVASATVNILAMAMTLVSLPLYVLFGHLSDRVGRKPVMVAGMVLALVAYFPCFHALASFANPALVDAQHRMPVTVVADPAHCSTQFDPLGSAEFSSACDIVRSHLAASGISYATRAAPAGAPTRLLVGSVVMPLTGGEGLDTIRLKQLKAETGARVDATLGTAGYPSIAAPERINFPGVLAALCVLVVAATALFGPMAAQLVELFPTRIRYSALSLPYHIGTGWVGGFLPVTAFSIVAARGDIYAGLWFPTVFTAIAVVTSLLFLPETKGRSLDA